METNLEHKIAEAYKKIDTSTSYPHKDELWDRIYNAQKSQIGLHGFWRIAAVLLAVFFVTGAFSSILFLNNYKTKIIQIEKRNFELQTIVDSFQNITPQIVTEIKYVEKEKTVYIPVEKVSGTSGAKSEEIEKLKNEIILQSKQFELETKILQIKTDSLLNELIVLNSALNKNSDALQNEKHTQSNLIELKTEKYEMPLQKPTQPTNPKLKIQLFPSTNKKTSFDMNTTIFKK